MRYQICEMTAEFKTLWELSQEEAFKQLADSARELVDIPIDGFNFGTGSDQIVIGILAVTILGVIFLPFGATETTIKSCQLNTNQKVLKLGGAIIVIMTSISAILYLEILKLSALLGRI